MVQRPDFLQTYNAIEVPAVQFAEDAIDGHVAEVSERFFEEIHTSLDLSPRTLGAFFEYTTKMLVPPTLSTIEGYQASDDYIKTFRRVGGQALASMLLTRTESNYSEFHFAKYPIHPRLESQIRELQHLERIEAGLVD